MRYFYKGIMPDGSVHIGDQFDSANLAERSVDSSAHKYTRIEIVETTNHGFAATVSVFKDSKGATT